MAYLTEYHKKWGFSVLYDQVFYYWKIPGNVRFFPIVWVTMLIAL